MKTPSSVLNGQKSSKLKPARPTKPQGRGGPILVLGRDGQVGRALAAALAPLGPLVLWGRAEADLSRPRELVEKVQKLRPAVVVNSAACTAVDAAETEPQLAALAVLVNADAPAALAGWAARHGALLVHFSTDYVHDGRKPSPYLEDDPPNPLNIYGRTKLAGDEAVLASGARALVWRSSWIFALAGRNFPNTILKLAAEKESLAVNADQTGAPTSAEFLAAATALALRTHLTNGQGPLGLCHLTASGSTTWLGWAQRLLARARELGWRLKAGPENLTATYGPSPAWPACRPLNSRLDTTKAQQDFGLHCPSWEFLVEKFLQDLKLINLVG
jgi:dTDP-4-dehydrorhamnose reductase